MGLVESLFAISFVTNLGLGIFLLKRTSQFYRKINFVFALLSFACASWVLNALLIFVTKDLGWKLFWIRMAFGTVSIPPAAFLHFSLIFPNYQHALGSFKTFLIYVPSAFLLGVCQTDLVVESILQRTPYIMDYGPVHLLFSFYLVTYLGMGVFFLLRSYARSTGLYRLQIKYCFLGILTTSIAAVTTNLILPIIATSQYSRLGPSFTMIHVGFTTYAIVKHRLMDINIVLKKGTTFLLLLFLLFVPSFALILLAQRVFFEKIDYGFSLLILLLLVAVAVSFQEIKPRTERAVRHLFFRKRFDYQETLGAFSKALVTILDITSLSREIVETVTKTMGVEKASLFLLNEEKGGYDLVESKNTAFPSPAPPLPKGDPLSHYLQKIGEITVREELMKSDRHPELKQVVDRMSFLEAEVSIPLITKGQLIGMMNLSHKFNKDTYSHEDIELLSMLANQAAIAIENARLYEDLRKSKSYIRRADRLASLGTLTAGLAHEIRNPLVAIKTFTQLLPERLDDEEFRNHFLSIASSEVDRISSLINELLEFARPSKPKLEAEDINVILDGMILLVSTEAKKRQVNLVKHYASDLPAVQVDREQIKQVFLNILLNAIDATPEEGTVTVKTRSFSKPGGESYIQVAFTDTGCGIPGEYMEEIFTPFFTTKSKGNGLGLSISNQIIQDHRGYIDVESQVDKGSSFFVNLPLMQEHPNRRRSDSGKGAEISLFDHR